MMRNCLRFCNLFLGLAIAISAVSKDSFYLVSTAAQPQQNPQTSRKCSHQPLPVIINSMMGDLPGYANRVSQRSRNLKRQAETFSYILVAGKANFKPLPLNPQPTSRIPNHVDSPGIRQVFFTTLERRYTRGKATEMQQYHWLLLTKTDGGWRKVSMRSLIGSYPNRTQTNLAPPRDSSHGVVGKGIDLWLRDCRANSIRSL